VALGGAAEEEGGLAAGTDPTPMETGDVSRSGAGEGEGKVGRWAGPWSGVQLAVGREGMTGGPRLGKEKKENEN
jgi:hypothetical protein